ncbi:MAG TPA: hypothetical protein PK156_16485, partial [Polyangium sp.]|nr:hypothetical protein [Polyangium sp.]
DVLVWNQQWLRAAELVDTAPDAESPVVLGLRARWIYADGDATQARELVEKAVRKAPRDLELRALQRRLFTQSGRLTSRVIASARGAPTLGQVELSLSQSIHRLQLTFDMEQGTRPISLDAGWSYGATYGAGGWWTFAPGWSWGADISVGAPAAIVPRVRVRSRLTLPFRPWLDGGLSYTYRRFTEAIDTHGMSAALGLTLRSELRLDATYWLTHVGLRNEGGDESSRWVQAVGFAAGRRIVEGLEWRVGVAHGAEAERLPTAFQLLDLVNDSAYLGLRIFAASFVAIEPLYGVAWRGPRGGTRQVQHTLEVGLVVKR